MLSLVFFLPAYSVIKFKVILGVVQKLANGNQGLKVNRSIIFLYTSVFHFFCFMLFGIIETQNWRTINIKQKISTNNDKTEIKILANPGLL